MSEVFLKVVNMSISAGWLVLAVLVLRFILKKAPKWVNVLLWGIVAVRLICPFSIESALSLIPSAQTLPEEIISGPDFNLQTGIAPVDQQVNDYLNDHYFEGVTVPTNHGANVMGILTVIWLVGMAILIIYTVVSYLRLQRNLSMAVILRENIFQCETVTSPFVLGILKPRIYLPYSMDAQNMEHVIAHEQAHIRRKDHWWKPLGFLLLTIYWFNPLMWVAYILLCRDIELACDEKVIAELGNEQRADYTQALVACSVNRRVIAACPLAFGEVGVKDRVKSIMNYRKPTFWVIVTALVVCVVVAVCFLTDPNPSREFSMSGKNVSSLDPEAIVERILDIEDIDNSNVYMNSENFDLQVDSNFNWANDQTVSYFYKKDHKTQSAQLRIFPDEEKYFVTKPTEWEEQELRFLLQRYLEAIKYLPQDAIREMAPADQYLIEHREEGRPADYDRVITYSSQGVEDIDGWYIHLQILPLHEDGEAYSGTGEEVLDVFYGDSNNKSFHHVNKWFDYLEAPEEMPWDGRLEINIPEFPDVTFRWYPEKMEAVTDDGITPLYTGMPIWNTYFCDLTGDGKPEICSQISYGSGMIDNRVIIYDYANGVSYKLEDRGYHDYYLRMSDANGHLYVDKKVYNSDELVVSGRLVFQDGCIQIEGVSSEPMEIPAPEQGFEGNLNLGLNAEVIGIDYNQKILYVNDIDKSAKVFGDRCAIDCTYAISRYNLMYVNYGDPNDVKTIDFSDFEVGDTVIIGLYDNQKRTAFNGIAVAEQVQLATQKFDNVGLAAVMQPTETNLRGLVAGYLFTPINGATYRYELSDPDPSNVTADQLLDTFTEETNIEGIVWEVYSLKEYPDRTKLLMISGTNGAWLCEYAPAKQAEEGALEAARAAGYVIQEDGNLTDGKEAWEEFYEKTQRGEHASIYVAHSYTLDPDRTAPDTYEAYRQDYPALYIDELSYDGEKFVLRTEEDVRVYEYLMKYTVSGTPVVTSAEHKNISHYVLTHDNTVTWEQLWNGLISSIYVAYIDHYTICTVEN